ncbi:hypothetical protein C7974DRAFT_437645 [Boeremia exigua]|uniref:uncharacterized protein n=1 Tax=Boeremia exigua TaxID=749465 RepID=UPI001E8E73F4|nr:uncharacterized protein C7974DRAFT_437645 [Boeremia exigua]KAH6613044.1 hypothetical protein C7974DRAFT_437645 [Boeremia exigua]
MECTAALVLESLTMHTTTHITEEAMELVLEKNGDGIPSVEGGSTTGLGKAISFRTELPHLCVPTTYTGSEMTPILPETENGVKTTRRDPNILPTAVLHDKDGYKALYVAWRCGICLGAVDIALHHNLCHTAGSTFNLPHAETHVAILPNALAYNASAAPEAMKTMAPAFPESEGDAVRGINALYRRLGVEVSLKTLGMPEAGIEKAAVIVAKNSDKNPATLESESIREIIRRAWAGEATS